MMSTISPLNPNSPVTNFMSHLRPTCVVDWLDLEFRCLRPTPAWRIQQAGGGIISHVTGLHSETGEAIAKTGKQGGNTPTTRFRARIQNPERFAAVTDVFKCDGIRERIDLTEKVLVTAIEVSFDLYARSETTPVDLAEVTALLVRGMNRPTNAQPRAYRERGTPTEIPVAFDDLLKRIKQGYCIGVGHRDDNIYLRAYLKTHDARRPLTHEHHRARVEVRLQGVACPIKTLDELSQFDFARLAKHFKFRVLNPEQSGLMRVVAHRQTAHGSVLNDKGKTSHVHRSKGRTRKTKPYTVASPLNEITRDQLRKLTSRWRSARERRKRHSSGAHDENSGANAYQKCPVSALPNHAPIPD